ncbi:MAG: NADH-quinone oxidoreductase subunit N, partial [Myxococcota bacterium]|nr:NADH-quinone oxidoreductase subunit N [Myxococcota bacterium]
AFSQILKLGLVAALPGLFLMGGLLGSFRVSARVDIPIFIMLATAGMMILMSATELLTLYVALELSAYGLFVLVGLGDRGSASREAAAKYVIFGAAASAVSLYGISLIFGAVGSTYLSEVAAAASGGSSTLLMVGVVLTLSGLMFKLALFPFHGWAPDVYQGGPHEAVTYVGTVSKVAAVGILARVLSLVSDDPGALVTALFILCVVSMTFGNLAALVQRDLKRLMAYSTVAHAGYILIGFLCFSSTGTTAAIFYGLAYLVMGFCAFLVICVLGRDGSNPTFDSLAGLHQRSPLLGLVLLVGIFGLAGIPPTPGFAGKWFLFTAGLEKQHFWLVFIAAVNATISLYYYLLVVKAAYLTPAGDKPSISLGPAVGTTAVVALLAAMILGVYPGPLWDAARAAATALLGG